MASSSFMYGRWGVFAIAVLAMVFTAPASRADPADCEGARPVTTGDYERALALAALNRSPSVLNEFVVPHWIGDTDQFWYQRSESKGSTFRRVDAATGRHWPAFDPNELARAAGAVSAVSLPTITSLQFTPDLRRVAVATSTGVYRCGSPTGPCRRQNDHVSATTARGEFFYQGVVSAATDPALQGRLVSPDGRHALFVKDHNLWLEGTAAGSTRQLTTDGQDHYGYAALPDGSQIKLAVRRSGRVAPPWFTFWSPDSTRIVTQRIDERGVPEYPFMTFVPANGDPTPQVDRLRYPLLGRPTFRREPIIIERDSGRRIPIQLPAGLLTGDVDLDALLPIAWSRDSTHLYAIAYREYLSAALLLDIDLRSGAVRVVHTEMHAPRVDLNSSLYGPPNVRILGDLEEFIWWSQHSGWGHLTLHDGRTGALKRTLTSGSWLVGDIVQVDAARRQLYATGYGREPGINPYYRNLYRIPLDVGEVERLTPDDADHLLLGSGNYVLHTDAPAATAFNPISPSGRYAVYGWSTPTRAPEFVIQDIASGRRVGTFERSDVSAAIAAGWRPPRSFVAKGADGLTDIHAQIYTPRHFCAERRYPIIDFVYPHPAVHQVQWNYTALLHSSVSPAALAELGFVVVTIDGRGSVYRSRDFAHSVFGHLDRTGLDDHVAVIDAMARQYSWIDRSRVGVYGRSYGGYATVRAMVEFPEVFKVGVAAAGPSSPQNMLDGIGWTAFQGAPRYRDGTHQASSPDEVPLNYAPLHTPAHADRIQGRLMIQMGNLDEHVAPGSTLQLVAAIVRARRNIDFVLLPDETHFLSFPYESLKRWDFFVQHLLQQLPPEWPASTASPDLASSRN